MRPRTCPWCRFSHSRPGELVCKRGLTDMATDERSTCDLFELDPSDMDDEEFSEYMGRLRQRRDAKAREERERQQWESYSEQLGREVADVIGNVAHRYGLSKEWRKGR